MFSSKSENQDSVPDLSVFFREPRKLFSEIQLIQIPESPNRRILWQASAVITGDGPISPGIGAFPWVGTGADRKRHVAQSKAICEGIERWAVHVHGLRNLDAHGFNFDKTSTGLAAFPDSVEQAREIAKKEAVERFVFSELAQSAFKINEIRISGWNGLFSWPARLLVNFQMQYGARIRMFRVENDSGLACVICLWFLGERGVCAGFAAEKSQMDAVGKSLVEAFRLRMNALRWSEEKSSMKTGFEAAAVFWAREADHNLISTWMEDRINSTKTIRVPRSFWIDEEIVGPWNPEVRMWRCLISGTLPLHNSPKTYLFY